MKGFVIWLCLVSCCCAQEVASGFSLRTTLSGVTSFSNRLGSEPRSGFPVSAGVRGVFYPTWKLNSHWSFSGAVQAYSRPYFVEQFTTQGHGLKSDVLQGYLAYSRVSSATIFGGACGSTLFGVWVISAPL